jgi:hypothetical protein
LTPGATYWYRVSARNTAGTSDPSNVASATTNLVDSPPTAPTGLTARAVSDMAVNLTWSDNSGDEDGFRIERATEAGFTTATVILAGENATSHADGNLSPGTTYYYRVYAFNAQGTSAPTEPASATTATSAGSGTGLTGKYYDYSTTDTTNPPSTSLAFSNLKLTRTDAAVNFNWGTGSPAKKISRDTFAVRWTGQVEPRYSEAYTFTVYADDGVRLWINGELITPSDTWRINWGDLKANPITLHAGQKYNIQLDYFENTQGALARLDWESASQVRQPVPRSQLYPTTTAGTPVYSAGGAAAPTAFYASPAAAPDAPAPAEEDPTVAEQVLA